MIILSFTAILYSNIPIKADENLNLLDFKMENLRGQIVYPDSNKLQVYIMIGTATCTQCIKELVAYFENSKIKPEINFIDRQYDNSDIGTKRISMKYLNSFCLGAKVYFDIHKDKDSTFNKTGKYREGIYKYFGKYGFPKLIINKKSQLIFIDYSDMFNGNGFNPKKISKILEE